MICNKYIYDFWKIVVYFAFSAVQLQGWQTMIICQRRSQPGKNKEIILYLTKKKRNMRKKQEVWIKVALPHTFCVLKFLTLSNNNWTSSSDQIKLISGDSFNFYFFFGCIFYQMYLTLSWRRPLSYRNQSIDLLRKSMDWFLYDNGLRHERVNSRGLHLNGEGVLQFAKNLIEGIRKFWHEKELLRQKKVSLKSCDYNSGISPNNFWHNNTFYSTQCK